METTAEATTCTKKIDTSTRNPELEIMQNIIPKTETRPVVIGPTRAQELLPTKRTLTASTLM